MNGIEGPVRRRILWAMEENQAAQEKLLLLVPGLEIDRALWEEITRHMANVQSHLGNIVGYLPGQEGSKGA